MRPRWLERSVLAQVPLGFASGLPYHMTQTTLAAWMARAHVDLTTIGLFALVSLPYNLKFLWAPALDRFRLPWLGRRRGWIAALQLAVAAAIAALGSVDAARSPVVLAVLALTVATLSASQDVVVDAYRSDSLAGTDVGRGTAAYVASYRIALICAGSGALVVADHGSWRAAYWLVAGLMVAAIPMTMLAPEPESSGAPPDLRAAVARPLQDLLRRPGVALALAVVMLYQIGEAIVRQMIMPFLFSLGFSNTEVGVVQNGFGMAATIVGCIVGGAVVDRIGVRRALIGFGLVQAVANLGYLGLDAAGGGHTLLIAAIGIDNVCNGLGTAAFVAYLTSLTDRRYSATQYALLTSASTVLGRVLAGVSGAVAVRVGWSGFFAGTIAVALPAIALVAAVGDTRFRRTLAVADSGPCST